VTLRRVLIAIVPVTHGKCRKVLYAGAFLEVVIAARTEAYYPVTVLLTQTEIP
jgi:hypothetical protein